MIKLLRISTLVLLLSITIIAQPKPNVEVEVQILKQELQLTEIQSQKIKDVLQNKMDEMESFSDLRPEPGTRPSKEEMDEMMTKMRSIDEKYNKQILELLSSDQQEKFIALRKRMAERRPKAM